MIDSEKKYVVVADGRTFRFNEQDWAANMDEFMKDHPEAEIAEVESYKADDYEDNDSIAVRAKGRDFTFSGKDWKANESEFMKDFPDAQLARVRGVDYYYNQANKLDEELKAKDEEIKAWQDSRADRTGMDWSSVMMQQSGLSPIGAGFDPERDAALATYAAEGTRLQQERDELQSRFDSNPRVIEARERAKQMEQEYRDGLWSQAESIVNNVGEDVLALKSVDRALDDTEAMVMEQKANRLANDTTYQRKEEYDKAGAAMSMLEHAKEVREGKADGFWEGAGHYIEKEIEGKMYQGESRTFAQVGLILKKLNDEIGSLNELTAEDIDKHLSKEDALLLRSYFELMSAQNEANFNWRNNWKFKAGEIAAAAIPFALEFAATSGAADDIAKGATKGLTLALEQWIADGIEKGGKALGRKAVSKAVDLATRGALKAAIMTAARPSTYGTIAQHLPEIDEDGNVNLVRNAAIGALDSYIETVSEMSGGMISDILGVPLKWGKGLTSKVFGNAFKNVKFPQWAKVFMNGAFKDYAKAVGFHGLPEEILEEYVGNALRLSYDKNAISEMHKDGNFRAMLLGFVPMTIMGGTASVARFGAVDQRAGQIGDKLYGLLVEKGFADSRAKALTERRTDKSPLELALQMNELREELEKKGASEEELEMVDDYALAVAEFQTLRGITEMKEKQDLDEVRADLTRQYGTYAHNGNVTTAKTTDGKDVFVVSDKSATGEYAAVDMQTGQHITISDADIATQNNAQGQPVQALTSKPENQYIGDRLLERNRLKEAERKLQERNEQIAKINELMPDELNLGTEGEPNMVVVKSKNANGVTVVNAEGIEAQMSWDAVGRVIGLPIHVFSDMELAEMEAQEIALKREALRAARAKTYAENNNVSAEIEQIKEKINDVAPKPEAKYTNEQTGEVDEVSFWENDPEGYCDWNDRQNKDGGADSIEQLENAIVTLTTQLDAATKASKTDNPMSRKAANREAKRLAERIQRLQTIQDGYLDKFVDQLMGEVESAEKRADAVIAMRERINEWREKFNLDESKLTVYESLDEVQNADARKQIMMGAETPGWTTGSRERGMHAYIYLPHVKDIASLDKTLMHEVVTHYGLKTLLGEKDYNALMDKVWNMMSDSARRTMSFYPGVQYKEGDERRRTAAEEFVALVAEDIVMDKASAEANSLWKRVADAIAEKFDKMQVKLSGVDVAGIVKDNYARLEAEGAEMQTEETAAENATANAEETLVENGYDVDEQNGDVRFSSRYITNDAQREDIISSIVDVTGRSVEDAERWLQSEESVASLVLADKQYLDYLPDDKYKAIKDNSDYPQGTVDFNNICRKRIPFTKMYTRLQRRYPNRIFTAEELADIRTIMSEDGLTVACGLCYVEDRRQKLGEVADAFISDLKDGFRTYGQANPTKQSNAAKFLVMVGSDAYVPTIYDLITLEGSDKLYSEHRGIWDAFGAYNRARGQQTQNTFQGYAEYKREILGWSKAKVNKVNSLGGLRVFSYSDFEAHHLLDLVQIIIDCAAKGVMIQGYTKVPEFARAVANTNIKLNRSLIPLGDTGIVDGQLAFDPVEGIDVDDPNFLESNDNVGNILIGINSEQIRLAMADPRIHYIIPYHARQAGVIRNKLNVGAWSNYIDTQNERDARTGKRVAENINIYTDILGTNVTNDREFVEKYLQKCKEMGRIPKFDEFLDKDAEGNYVYTPGYYKFLVDFKLFDESGNILPQKPVVAQFDDAFNMQILQDYAKGERETTGEQMNATYDKIVETLGLNEEEAEGEDIRFKTANRNQTIFVSNAAKAVEGINMGKAAPEQWLKTLEKNGGLKAGEDKWIGLSEWLKTTDKKSVTKQELLDFINENAIKIEEVHYGDNGMHNDTLWYMYEGTEEYEKAYQEQLDMDAKKFAEGMLQYKKEQMSPEEYQSQYEDYVETYKEDPIWQSSTRSHVMANWRNNILPNMNVPKPTEEVRKRYRTEGLENNHEIALVVPTVEQWHPADRTHFGDAGSGRAVVWARFGDAIASDGRRVLVVDEVQSDRHQQGRTKGYSSKETKAELDTQLDALKVKETALLDFTEAMAQKYPDAVVSDIFTDKGEFSEEDRAEALRLKEEYKDEQMRVQSIMDAQKKLVPEAPFEKNWAELGMKRVLRYAAENGYDAVAWTKGEQQEDRYSLDKSVNSIRVGEWAEDSRLISIDMKRGYPSTFSVNRSGEIKSGIFKGKALSEVLGKEMANIILSKEGEAVIEGEELRTGNEGLKSFYNHTLPSFMNKYGKKWGAKVSDITLPNVEEAGRVMHSVPVTEEMRESVMEGQTMFKTVFGGNKGYVGYSMSKRAAEARREGRFPKGDFRKWYNITANALDLLVYNSIIDANEWHHTSMYGNRTTFYGWYEDTYADKYAENKKEVDALAREFVNARKEHAESQQQISKRLFANEIDPEQSFQEEKANNKAYHDKIDEISAKVDAIFNPVEPTGSEDDDIRFRTVSPHQSSLEEITEMFNEWNKEDSLRPLFRKAYDFCNEIDLDVKFVSEEEMVRLEGKGEGEQGARGINWGEKIRLNSDVFANIPDQLKASIILHEMIHAATNYILVQKEERLEYENHREAKREFEAIFDEIKNKFPDQYGSTDVNEMVAEMAKPEFRDIMKQGTWWERFLNAIRRLLGISEKDYDRLTPVLASLYELMDNPSFELFEEAKPKSEEYTLFKTAITPEVRKEMDVIAAQAMVNGNYLLAPNSKETKLTPEQWALVRTKNFKQWFGDWINDPENASKVVDENGEPKVVYHQTNAVVYINRETGENWDELDWKARQEWDERDDWDDYWEEQDFNTFSRVNARTTNELDGFFFAPEFDKYHEYGERTIPAFLNIKNPASREDYYIDSSKNNAGREERIRLQNEGYDGVIREEDGMIWEYVAFNPNQIKSATENNGEYSEDNEDIRFKVRTKPAPVKTKEVYKLMRLGKDGMLYPLFIGGAEAIILKKWYDADSPNLGDLTKLATGIHLVNNETGEAMTFEEFKKEHPEMKLKKKAKKPNPDAINWATENGMRWVLIEDKGKKQKRYGGETRSYYNLGINGAGGVGKFAMRPGWHAGSLPSMRQIGKGANKDLRDDSFVWVRGRVPADVDYQAEADANPDKDIPTHIPTDGYYMKATNANKKTSQADRIGWYVAGSFIADEIISDAEARRVIDEWNKEHPKKKVEYDFPRESGREFDPARGGLVESDTMFKTSKSTSDIDVDELVNTGRQKVNAERKIAADARMDKLRAVNDALAELNRIVTLDETAEADAIIDMARKLATSNDTSYRLKLALDPLITAAESATADAEREDAVENLKRLLIDNNVKEAAFAQREYDEKTVKSIAQQAKELLEVGALADMTRGEIKRLIGAITSATGKRDLTKSVNRLMDVMIANQLRMGRENIDKFLKVRGKKVDARGVEVQGKLDIEGQQIMDAVRENIGDDLVDILFRMVDVEEKLSDPSETVRRNAENELAGLELARQYVETIKESEKEEKKLRKEVKDAEEEYKQGRLDRKAFRDFVKTVDQAIRENRIERVKAYQALAESFAKMMTRSIENAGQLREAEKRRIQRIQHFANSDMQGMPSNEHGSVDSKWLNNPVVRFFLKPLATFDQMLRQFGSKSVNGEGYLWNHFMRGWLKATEAEYKGVQAAHNELDAKAQELFGRDGVKRWSDIFEIDRKLPGATLPWWDGGEMKDHEITQGNMLYIYMVNKMTDGKMKLRKMGIDESDVARLVDNMDPRFIEAADWIQDVFLPGLRDRYNAVHERLFGAPMAAIDSYFPIRVLANARVREVDLGVAEGNAKPSTMTGSIIKRTRNSLALDILGSNAFDVVLEHIQQMEHWAAFAEFNRDLNTLLSYRLFRNRVQNMSGIYGAGKEAWNNFRSVAEMAAGVYEPASKSDSIDKTAMNLAKGVTAAKISFRVYTAIKQLLSMPAFISDASAVNLAKTLANPKGAWDWAMENLPLFEKRWKSRQAGDSRLMQTESDWKIWKDKVVELAGRYGMSPNAFVDAITVAIGAKSIYETKKSKYLKYGYPEAEADEKAKQDATILFNESQQSNESAFLSTMQVDRTVASVAFSLFRNSSMGYERMFVDALRNIKHLLTKGYKAESIEFMRKQFVRDGLTEDQAERAAERAYGKSLFSAAMRAVTFGFVVQFAWNLGGYLPYLIAGDDDDEKKDMIKDAARHALIGGPVEGLTGGSIISEAGNMIAKGDDFKNYSPTLLPVVSDFKKVLQMFAYDEVAAANEVFNILVQAGVGVNPQTFTDIGVAIYDACNGDLETMKEATLCLLRILQIPQSQADKVYIDEIDFTADKGLELTIQEFAERYADYKVRRGAPVTGWMYSDEKQKEREEKYIARFKKMAEEYKRTRGNEEAKAYYEYLDNEYKEVSTTLADLKSKMKAEEMKGNEMGSLEFAEMLDDYMKSDVFQRYSLFGGKAKAIEKIRDMLLKVDERTMDLMEDVMLQLRKEMVEEMEQAKAETDAND